jgi:soluble lytic murein transglycosylase-like protein
MHERHQARDLAVGSLCFGLSLFCSAVWAPTVASQPTAENDPPSALLQIAGLSAQSEQTPRSSVAPHSIVKSGASDDGPSTLCKAAGREEYLALIRAQAERNALPAAVAEAVTHVESRYHPEKIGKVGEIGLMQIRPATAATLGFRGHYLELADPATNIRYGVAYLARAWRLAEGDLCRALMKYRAGHRQEHMSPLSRQYCALAKTYLRQNGVQQQDLASIAAPRNEAPGESR